MLDFCTTFPWQKKLNILGSDKHERFEVKRLNDEAWLEFADVDHVII
jgi:hypothetical protein